MANFTPVLGDYTELKPFRFWCQKVLPLVYDDSLSYYELLCKVVDYLNKTMEDVDTLHTDVTNLHQAYVELQGYVNDYFDNLDVQQEINNKLDAMAQDGSLSALINPFIPDIVSDWLGEHITPTTPIVDDTFTIEGAAADSKKVGEFKKSVGMITYMFNFEDGSYTTENTDTYTKIGANNVARNIVPFYADAGTVFTCEDGYVFNLCTLDENWNRTGTTGWVNSYELTNNRYCYMAFYATDESEIVLPSGISDVFSEEMINLMCTNNVLSKLTDNDFNDILDGIRYLFNFELGTYSTANTNSYIKVDASNTARTIVPFYVKEGATIELLNSNYEAIVLLLDSDLNRVAQTPWFDDSYTFRDSHYAGFLAVKTKNQSDITFPSDLYNIFTENTIKYLCNNALVSETIKDVKLKIAETTVNIERRIDTISYLNNYEYGSYLTTGAELYQKIHADNVCRNIVPFRCEKGDTISVVSGYKFNMVTFTDEWIRTGTTGWVTSYTLSNNRYCYLAFKSDNDDFIHLPDDVTDIFSENSIKIMNNKTVLSQKFLDDEIEEKLLKIKDANIYNMDTSIIASPNVTFSSLLPQNTGVSAAKGAIFKHNDSFCVTYGENLDGNANDFPEVTQSGVLAMKYKYFKLVNGTETNVAYGEIAKRGDVYTDYEGNTAIFTGGCGLPSGCNNKQYFTSAYIGNKKYNGKNNYGMTPCCCDVNVSDNGVTFGNILELKLLINGVSGKFDLTRIDEDSYDYGVYLTTAPPYYDGQKYHWMIPIRMKGVGRETIRYGGLAYLNSVDGVTWNLISKIKTPVNPSYEVTGVVINNTIICALRTDGYSYEETPEDCSYIIVFDTENKIIKNWYRIPNISTRSYLVRTGNDILYFYTPYQKNIADCVRIIFSPTGSNELYFFKWFSLIKTGAWYVTCNEQTVLNYNFTKMYIVGGNDEGPSTQNGMTFMELTFDASDAKTMRDVSPTVL